MANSSKSQKKGAKVYLSPEFIKKFVESVYEAQAKQLEVIQAHGKKIDEATKKHDEFHEELGKKIDNLEKKITPITTIYEKAEGFGAVSVWIAKWIVTPIIVVAGLWFTYLQTKNIK